MYDPQFAVGGHQPLGFDQNMTNYTYFTVIGSRIKFTYVPDAAAGAIPGYFGCFVDDDSSIQYLTATEILESKQGMAKTAIAGSGSASGNVPVSTRSRFSAKKAFGSKKVLTNLDYAGTKIAPPTIQRYYQLWIAAIGGNDPDSMNFLVEIEYLAILTKPTFMAPSI